MRLSLRLLQLCVFVTGVSSAHDTSPSSTTANGNCRCVPDQWEGVLTTSEHEVDLFEGKHHELRSNVVIHYDYRHSKLATYDVTRHRRSVADYNQVNIQHHSFLIAAMETRFRSCTVSSYYGYSTLWQILSGKIWRSNRIMRILNYYYL